MIGNDHARLELYGPGEIVAGHEFYDYAAKYTAGLSETSTAAEVDAETRATILKIARDAYRAIGAEGFARIDFLLRGDGRLPLRDQHDPGLHADQPLPDDAGQPAATPLPTSARRSSPRDRAARRAGLRDPLASGPPAMSGPGGRQ